MDSLLSGKLIYVFLVSILDAAILSLAALWWFQRTVRALMLRSGGSEANRPETSEQLASESSAPERPRFALFEPAREATKPARPEVEPDGRLRRRLLLAYTLGATAYSFVMTTLELATESGSRPLAAWLALAWVNAWPLAPTLIAVLALDRRSAVRAIACYIGAGAVAVALLTFAGQLLRGTFSAAPITNVFWMLVALVHAAWAPLLLIMLTGWRRIRAIMPLALAATLAFGFALVLFGELMIQVLDVGFLRSAVLTVAALTSTQFAYYSLFLLMSLAVGAAAWKLLQALAARFERKRFSDVQLIVDCWWLIVTAQMTAIASTELGWVAVLGGAAAFAAYRSVVALILRRRSNEGGGQRLLLLRVFGYQRRTESLFDRVAQRWRFHGPVQLISGVDLATRTADPGDMLKLLSGRLGEQYLASLAEVDERIARLDAERDPDGRFRVNDVYCHDDTWRPAVQALLDSSDCVLMGVRSFAEQNQGCIFELEQLVLRVPTEAIVLVYDRTTDLPLLGDTLGKAWRSAREAGRARQRQLCAGSSRAQQRKPDRRAHGPLARIRRTRPLAYVRGIGGSLNIEVPKLGSALPYTAEAIPASCACLSAW